MRVFDYDFGAEDDFLGSAVADVQPLCDGRQHDLELQLRGEPAAAGDGGPEAGTAGEGASKGDAGGSKGGKASSGEEAGAAGSTAPISDTASSEAEGSDGSGTVQLSCRFLPFTELLADEVDQPEVDGQPVLATPGEVRAAGMCLCGVAGVQSTPWLSCPARTAPQGCSWLLTISCLPRFFSTDPALGGLAASDGAGGGGHARPLHSGGVH